VTLAPMACAALVGLLAAGPGPTAADAVYAFEALEAPAHPRWSRSEPVALRLEPGGASTETVATVSSALEAALRSWGAAFVVRADPATASDPWAEARAAGCELGVEITWLGDGVEARLVELGGRLWDAGTRVVARRRVSTGDAASANALPNPRTMQVHLRASFEAEVRAIEVCGPWLAALGDRALHVVAADGTGAPSTVELTALEVGPPARDPAVLLGCSESGLQVGHGAWRRSGTVDLPPVETERLGRGALRPVARLALGPGMPNLEAEPGTNRWRSPRLDRPVVDVARIGGAWWLVRPDGRIARRGRDGVVVELPARVGRGLAALPETDPAYAVTSEPDGPPEALSILDADGRLERRLPFPAPVLDVATASLDGQRVIFVLHGNPRAPRLSRVTW
jgi:hypothetical protein